MDLHSHRRVVSYSDGEGADGCVGVAIWVEGAALAEAGYIAVPEQVRKRWAAQRGQDSRHDIFEIEAVGPLILLSNFAELLRGSLWLHFIDNDAALSSLVNGFSSVMQGEEIVGATWSRIQDL